RRAPEERKKDFIEVAQGYDDNQALAEANRCLNCKKPKCIEGCPVETPIPRFIQAIRKGNLKEAAAIIKEKNSLPAVCGRVCPQEVQCEANCILNKKGEPVAIGALERYVADKERESGISVVKLENSHKKIAVIGSGPSSLTAAADLALYGYKVTVFEALHELGGVLRYGIPEFRLPKAIVDAEISYIKKLGVTFQTNVIVGVTVSLEDLKAQGYKAFFIGAGAGLPYFLGIPGENLNGVYSANEFLTRVNLMSAYKFPEVDTPIYVGEKVAVVGAGNVAMDSARTALRLGAKEAHIVYRRSRQEIPAREEEVENAEEEGVIFNLLRNPVEILGDENFKVKGLRCQKMQLGNEDKNGRRLPEPIDGEFDIFDVDMVIIAVGQGPNPLATRNIKGLETDKKGLVITDENNQTSIPGVFAGGDIVTGAATVIKAMGAGKAAAKAIDEYIKSLG
ncbi:MAG: NADPH-dependent glutamate synthase, partial [Firmicutes bacterium]|nr:NADPH-dependent glutamate synthase [Bacillota bacterium]